MSKYEPLTADIAPCPACLGVGEVHVCEQQPQKAHLLDDAEIERMEASQR